MNILVTGGAGYIGSHTSKLLKAQGHMPIAFDNLSRGWVELARFGPFVFGDIRNENALFETLSKFQVDAVIHFAAKAYVEESPAGAQGWAPPKCELKPGHYLVNSGLLYLRNASSTKYEEQRQKDLRDADRVLTQAVTKDGQEGNAAAWYYLGRRYTMVGDLAGADSTFRRAEQLAPQCAQDIQVWRRYLWTPLYNKGVQAYQAGITDSALYYFRRANVIHREPAGLSAMAALFATGGEVDSAAFYYGEVIRVTQGGDSTWQRLRREAMFNRGAVYNQAKRWTESEFAFREFLAVYPGDVQALHVRVHAGVSRALERGHRGVTREIRSSLWASLCAGTRCRP